MKYVNTLNEWLQSNISEAMGKTRDFEKLKMDENETIIAKNNGSSSGWGMTDSFNIIIILNTKTSNLRAVLEVISTSGGGRDMWSNITEIKTSMGTLSEPNYNEINRLVRSNSKRFKGPNTDNVGDNKWSSPYLDKFKLDIRTLMEEVMKVGKFEILESNKAVFGNTNPIPTTLTEIVLAKNSASWSWDDAGGENTIYLVIDKSTGKLRIIVGKTGRYEMGHRTKNWVELKDDVGDIKKPKLPVINKIMKEYNFKQKFGTTMKLNTWESDLISEWDKKLPEILQSSKMLQILNMSLIEMEIIDDDIFAIE